MHTRDHPTPITRHLPSRGGFTLLEVLFVISISVLVTAAVVGMMVATARRQREGMFFQQVYDRADRVEDKTTLLLQGGSKEAGIFLNDLNQGFYREIVYREGTGPTFANKSLRFDPQAQQLIFDPDMSIDDNEQIIVQSRGYVFLESVDFQSGQKVGGIPDSGVILVRTVVSDRGSARRAFRHRHRYQGDRKHHITSSRTFAVNLRRY